VALGWLVSLCSVLPCKQVRVIAMAMLAGLGGVGLAGVPVLCAAL
jgi:hypothetical protein